MIDLEKLQELLNLLKENGVYEYKDEDIDIKIWLGIKRRPNIYDIPDDV